jgi:DNA-binding MarR family transcriptional regulator
MLERLESEGLVKSERARGDRRVRPVTLTRSGRQLAARSKAILWPRIEAAVADACAGATGPLLAQLAALEDALAAAPLQVRAARSLSRERGHDAA